MVIHQGSSMSTNRLQGTWTQLLQRKNMIWSCVKLGSRYTEERDAVGETEKRGQYQQLSRQIEFQESFLKKREDKLEELRRHDMEFGAVLATSGKRTAGE